VITATAQPLASSRRSTVAPRLARTITGSLRTTVCHFHFVYVRSRVRDRPPRFSAPLDQGWCINFTPHCSFSFRLVPCEFLTRHLHTKTHRCAVKPTIVGVCPTRSVLYLPLRPCTPHAGFRRDFVHQPTLLPSMLPVVAHWFVVWYVCSFTALPVNIVPRIIILKKLIYIHRYRQ